MSKIASYLSGGAIVLLLGGIGAYAYVTAPTQGPSQGVTNPPPSQEVAGQGMEEGRYVIISEESTASFSLDEDLRGERITVLGTTNQVSGSLKVDRRDIAAASFEPIRINARTFVTDSEQRNNAIRRLILKTENDANEFIEFTPKTVTSAPASVEVDQAFPFVVVGDLKVSGVTKEVSFEGTATFTDEKVLSGRAQTRVHYPDFGLSVPNLSFLANVDKDTTLSITFVAKSS